ncbi:MAG: YadA-like family protein [Cardiobacteriaceae bacterium]|nr:YadA-like family protein [Cardiobacteriaceae bacterium]
MAYNVKFKEKSRAARLSPPLNNNYYQLTSFHLGKLNLLLSIILFTVAMPANAEYTEQEQQTADALLSKLQEYNENANAGSLLYIIDERLQSEGFLKNDENNSYVKSNDLLCKEHSGSFKCGLWQSFPAGSKSSVVGISNNIIGSNSAAVGFENTVNGHEASAFGSNNTVNGHEASAFGIYNTAKIQKSSAFGYDNRASQQYSSAFGAENRASGQFSSAFGYDNTTKNTQANAFGSQNTAKGEYSAAVGYNNTAHNNSSYAFGANNNTYADNSSAFGLQNTTSGLTSSAFGSYNNAKGERSSAFGYSNEASKESSSAFGYQNTATGNSASAFGYKNKVSSDYSSAFGYNNTIDTREAVAVGMDNTASARYSSVFGVNSKALVDYGTAIGYKSYADRPADVRGYSPAKDDVSTENNYIWKATSAALAIGDTHDTNKITRQITGVAAGSEDTDAVNVAQLKEAVKSGANFSPIKVSDDSGTDFTVDSAGSLTIAGGSNINTTADNSNTLTVSLNNNVDLGSSGSLQVGDTTINNNGKITGLTAGSAAGEAVEYSQLSELQTKIATLNTAIQNNGSYFPFTIKDNSGNDFKVASGGTVNIEGSGIITTKADNGTLTISADLSDYATEQFVTGQGYQTSNQVNTAITNRLNGYATQTWVQQQGYLTSTDKADLQQQIADNAVDLTDYAKTADVNNTLRQYSTTSQTQKWVQDQGYLTADDRAELEAKIKAGNIDLSDYAKTEDVDNKLTEYTKTADLGNVIADETAKLGLVNQQDLDNQLNDYATIAKVEADYLKKAELSGAIEDKAKDMELVDQTSLNDQLKNLQLQSGNYVPISVGGDTGEFEIPNGGRANFVGDGTNISTVADGDTVTINLNKDIQIDSVNAGGTVVNQDGVALNSGVALTNQGLNNGGQVISNVAPGVRPTDAVNVGQLNSAMASMSGQLSSRIETVDKNANAGTASALAASTMPVANAPGEAMMGFTGGTYRGQQGYAIGYSQNSQSGRIVFRATGSGNSKGHYGASVGVGVKLW